MHLISFPCVAQPFFCVISPLSYLRICQHIENGGEKSYLNGKTEMGPLNSLNHSICFEKYSDNITNIYHLYYCFVFGLKTGESSPLSGTLQLRSTSKKTYKLLLPTDVDKIYNL